MTPTLPTLQTQLEQYRPWNAVEAAHQVAMLELLHSQANSQANPFDRSVYRPGHITGSVWIWAEETAQVALIYHRRLNRWLQPGGHAEPGETDGRSTALRELREEVGLVLEPASLSLFDLDVHEIPATAAQPNHFHYDLRYICRTHPQPLTSDSDAAQVRWFTLAELEVMTLDESMQRMLEKTLRAA